MFLFSSDTGTLGLAPNEKVEDNLVAEADGKLGVEMSSADFRFALTLPNTTFEDFSIVGDLLTVLLNSPFEVDVEAPKENDGLVILLFVFDEAEDKPNVSFDALSLLSIFTVSSLLFEKPSSVSNDEAVPDIPNANGL